MRFSLLTVSAPLVLLAACGGSETSEEASPATESATTASPSAEAGQASISPTMPGKTEVAARMEPPAAFAQCRACHSVELGKNGVGPTLFGIVGSKAGEVQGYNFSPALAKSGITWDRASLDTWLAGPIKMVPGAKMVIAQPDPEKRNAIIDYLETLK